LAGGMGAGNGAAALSLLPAGNPWLVPRRALKNSEKCSNSGLRHKNLFKPSLILYKGCASKSGFLGPSAFAWQLAWGCFC
jgi:hypothetical protein